jgi:hypothetical protein
MLCAFDSTIPVPSLDGRGKPTPWPFASMQPGDSFPVEPDDVRTVRCAAYAYARRHPSYSFVVRKSYDGGGHRCWRIE